MSQDRKSGGKSRMTIGKVRKTATKRKVSKPVTNRKLLMGVDRDAPEAVHQRAAKKRAAARRKKR